MTIYQADQTPTQVWQESADGCPTVLNIGANVVYLSANGNATLDAIPLNPKFGTTWNGRNLFIMSPLGSAVSVSLEHGEIFQIS